MNTVLVPESKKQAFPLIKRGNTSGLFDTLV